MEEKKETEVTKDWANPTPAGLVALAVACFVFFALLNGFVEPSAMPLIGCWLLGGALVQFTVALIDFKGGNMTGGNTFLFFSAFFMLAGGLEMFVKHQAVLTAVPVDARIDGWAWMALTCALLLWTPAFLKPFSLLSVIVLALDVAVPFITLIDLKVLPASFAPIPAFALLLAGAVGIYFSAALVVNSALGRKFYPTL
jgi:succinate-acetate transporter protein